MNRYLIALAAAGAAVFGAPASAGAEVSLTVEGSQIVLRGDDGPNPILVGNVENERQIFVAPGGTRASDGCRALETFPQPDGRVRIGCALAGITAFSVDTGAGDDHISFPDPRGMFLPTFADLGPGTDHWEVGSTGIDTVSGGPGNDELLNGFGPDVLRGGPDNDVVVATEFDDGPDQIFGEEGDDRLNGGIADDLVDGGPGRDDLDGGVGNDVVAGGDGNDHLLGRDGDDRLSGGNGNDYLGSTSLTGAATFTQGVAMCSGAPTIGPGEEGNDRLGGGDGNDRLCGGLGVDQLSAGPGADALSSLDNGRDGAVACGSGADFLTLDRNDPAGPDCERLAQDDAVRLSRSGVVSLPVGCAGACTGSLKIVEVPDNPVPTPEAFREHPPAVGKRVVARSRVSLERRASRLRLRLPAQTTRALRKRGQTVVEAQLTVRVGRRQAAIRRMFPITK